ncbi:cyanophycinase [Natronospira sp.]|uniref:cyanophycinase n=1 Tax=Natronospira sp. TaxID=2024970 RepID=UPI003872F941
MPYLKFAVLSLFFALSAACFSESDASSGNGETSNGGEALLVLAGGGAEGDVGDTSSWSYGLYSRLLDNGDIHGDGVVRVAILATSFPSNPSDRDWLGEYFVWIGDTLGKEVSFENVEVDSRNRADDPAVVDGVADADVIFIRGGDQWEYVTWWKGTLLESHIRDVHAAGGAIGGTSAGAMSLSSLSYASGQDMISTDVLYDSHSSYLDDRDGGSGIHEDFLAFLDNAVVDTHYTWRGRMGRLLGIHAKAIDDGASDSLVGIGIEEYSGIVVQEGEAEVIGHGGVSFFTSLQETEMVREPGRPLIYTDVRLDRLSDGWRWSFDEAEAIPPIDAESVDTVGEGPANDGALFVDGAVVNDADYFQWLIFDSPFELEESTRGTVILEAAGHTHALEDGERGYRQETVFSALGDGRVQLGLLLFHDDYNGVSGAVERSAEVPDQLLAGPDLASIFINARSAEFQAEAANFDSKNGVDATLGMSGLRVHVLADSDNRDMALNSRTGQVETIASGGEPGNGDDNGNGDDDGNGGDDGDTDSVELELDPYRVRGRHHVDLSWTGLEDETAVVFRDGEEVAVVDDSDSYTDVPGGQGGGSYVYQLCDAEGARCSDSVTAEF